jgi:hypothetical protein
MFAGPGGDRRDQRVLGHQEQEQRARRQRRTHGLRRNSGIPTAVQRVLSVCSMLGNKVFGSVADPDPNPDPSDPYVFVPPGSGSISQRYRSGSFYHQAKIVSKTLLFCDFFLLFIFEK